MTAKLSLPLRLYKNNVLNKPVLVIFILLTFFLYFGYRIKDFKLDASADSLVLENDDDLNFERKIKARYGESDYLFLTYTPKDRNVFSKTALNEIKEIKERVLKVDGVLSVLTILDVPLLKSPPIPIKDLKTRQITLLSEDVDFELAKEELRNSPLFKELLVSVDLRSIVIKVDLVTSDNFKKLMKRRSNLIMKKYNKTISSEESAELQVINMEYKKGRSLLNQTRHQQIIKLRRILNKYKRNATVFMGGIPMVSDDMVTFVKNDLQFFGLGMVLFLICTLKMFFKIKRWIFLPMLCCLVSVVFMVGAISVFGWSVTVISSNFISLQLIITMSLTVHLIVRYSELMQNNPDAPKKFIVFETVRTIFTPCLYTSLTTIAGFSSLIFCEILPVVNFGLMMTIGLVVSLIVTFLLFPAVLMVLNKKDTSQMKKFGFSLTDLFAYVTEKHGGLIFSISIIVFLLTVYGITKLEVENSFIDYFKKTTEIYRGMKVIDQDLGGTTPLDVIIDFKDENTQDNAADAESDNEEFDEFDDFEEKDKNSDKYWYSVQKMDIIEKVHDYLESSKYTGKVLSLGSLLKVIRMHNGGKKLDNFDLALLYSEIPDNYKEMLLAPYASVENNQARINLRIKDSFADLRRDAFLKKIDKEIKALIGNDVKGVRLSGAMVLYNNMLQSLFKSQIQTIGFTVLALMIMFIILFRSIKIALIAIFPNLMASLVVLGLMGILGLPLDIMTITIVAISVGIAVDNTIHYIHRFEREFENKKDYLVTMHKCHGSIGNAMYYTSITIIVGFSILSFSNFIPSILFGVLTGLAMFMALLSALTLLPRMIMFFKPFGSEQVN